MKTESAYEYFAYLLGVLLLAVGLYCGVVYFTHENMGNVGSFMSGVFGSAVALAGAFVAIKLATHALRLQRDQQAREDIQSHFEMINIISNNLEEASRSIIDVLSGIQIIYTATVVSEDRIINFTKKHVPSGNSLDLVRVLGNIDADMADEIQAIREQGTRRVQEALYNMAEKCRDNPAIRNPISAFLLSKIGGKEFAFSSSVYMVTLSNMQLWAAYFQTAADSVAEINRLDDRNYLLSVVAARTINVTYVMDKDGNEFDDRALRSLFLIDLLCSKDGLAKVFFDFHENLPVSSEIIDAVKMLLPSRMHISAGLIEVLRNFNLHGSVEPSLLQAFKSFRIHQPQLQRNLLDSLASN